MIRLDRYLCEMGEGTRSEVKELLRKGRVSVDGCPEKNPARKVDEKSVQVCMDGRLISYAKNVYFLMNKPSGLLSATRDGHGRTVLDWMREREPENVLLRRDLFPVGRLDKDTEGLLLITDDGALAHRLLSPARHVKKTYYVETDGTLSEEACDRLRGGVDIGEEERTRPAEIREAKLEGCAAESRAACLLTITEGKYHQVKRMMQSQGRTVTYLRRVSMGPLLLGNTLPVGEFRPLSREELAALELAGTKEDEARTDCSERTGAEENGSCVSPFSEDGTFSDVREMLSGIDTVIFDLDGTLVDSMWVWPEIDVEYLGRYGIQLDERLQGDIDGMSFTETAEYFKERFGIPDSVEKIKEDWNRMAEEKYLHQVPLKKGAREFIEACRKKKWKLGIATSNSRQLVEGVIGARGLKDAFSCILTSCEVGKGKPAPDIYLAVAERLGADPARCLVFEDIEPGIRAGKAAGMRVCAVKDDWCQTPEIQLRRLADYYIADYTELIDMPHDEGQ